MTFEKYQKEASRTINYKLSGDHVELHALHCLSSEVGEVHSIYQKIYQGHPFSEEHVKKEIGDCLWALAELCTVNSWNLGEIAEMNIAKLRARYPDGFDVEHSLHRKEGDI